MFAPALQPSTSLLAQELLGKNFLVYLTLALGASLALGTGLALAKPQKGPDGELIKAPVGRSMIQISIGSLAAIWAIATLFVQ